MKKKIMIWTCLFVLMAQSMVYGKAVTSKQEVMDNLEEVLDTIEKDYYKGVNWQKIYENTLQGALQGTDNYGYFIPGEYLAGDGNLDLVDKAFGLGISYEEILFEGKNSFLITVVHRGSPAEKAGILRDDIITGINGGVPRDMLNQITNKQEAVKITIYRSDKFIEISVTPGAYEIDSVIGFLASEWLGAAYLPENHQNIGIISIEVFDAKTSSQFVEVVKALKNKGVQKIVLDLRYNGGGHLDQMLKVADLLVPQGYKLAIREKDGTETEIIGGAMYSESKIEPFEEVVVLVNEYSASASEILAGILQSKGHAVVGKKTFGKGVGQMVYMLSNEEDAYQMTVIEIFVDYNGQLKKINDVGIMPSTTASYVNTQKSVLSETEWKTILNDMGYPGTYNEASLLFNKEWELKEVNYLTKSGKLLASLSYEVFQDAEIKECAEAVKIASQNKK